MEESWGLKSVANWTYRSDGGRERSMVYFGGSSKADCETFWDRLRTLPALAEIWSNNADVHTFRLLVSGAWLRGSQCKPVKRGLTRL